MKKFLIVLASACIAVSVFFCGCANGRDGRDGVDGHDVTIQEIYEKYVEEYGDISYADFLKEYLDYTNAELDELTGLQSKINKSLTSGVTILSTFSYKAQQSGTHLLPGSSFTYKNIYTGSGAILWLDKDAGDAYVVTNCHVVYDDMAENVFCKDVRLYLYGQDEIGVNFSIYKTSVRGYDNYEITGDSNYCINAEVVGASKDYDLALLKVSGSEVIKRSKCVSVAEFSDAHDVTVGQTVYTVGNASSEGMSASSGIISKDSEYVQLALTSKEDVTEADLTDYRVMRITAPVNPGNSGGALYDLNGKIVGIVNSKDEAEGIDNMAYALPASSAKNVLKQLYNAYAENGNKMSSNGGFNKALLGITTEVSDSYALFDENTNTAKIVQHVRVGDVSKNPATGKLSAGDYLKAVEILGSDGSVKMEKFSITREYHMREALLAVSKGDTVKLTVERKGEELTVEIKFDSDYYFNSVK